MKSLKEKILSKIDSNNIEPKSKHYFLLMNIAAWFLTIITILISGFLAGVLYFTLINSVLIPQTKLAGLVLALLVFIALGIYLGYRHFMLIKNAYRNNIIMVLSLLMAILFMLGFALVQSRLYGALDHRIGKHLPGISLQRNIQQDWSDPERTGRLAGEIIAIDEEGMITLKDFDDQLHIIDPILLETKKRELFISNLRVRMHGYQDAEIFYPQDIAPWALRKAPREFRPDYNQMTRDQNIFFPHKNER